MSMHQNWKHLEGLTLADPEYNKPGAIDVLLGVETFFEVIRHARWFGPRNTLTALDTAFGWVLAGSTGAQDNPSLVSTHFTSVATGDNLLHRLWEIEKKIIANCTITPEEQPVLEHFNSHYAHDEAEGLWFHYPSAPWKPISVNLALKQCAASYRLREPSISREFSLKYRKLCKSTLTRSMPKKFHLKTVRSLQIRFPTYLCTLSARNLAPPQRYMLYLMLQLPHPLVFLLILLSWLGQQCIHHSSMF